MKICRTCKREYKPSVTYRYNDCSRCLYNKNKDRYAHKIDKNCSCCGKKFRSSAGHLKCHMCRMGIYTRTCIGCEKEYKPSSRHRYCPKCRADRAKHPCKDCGNLIYKDHKVCVPCNNARQKGPNNPNWKGGKTKHHGNYIMRRAPGHPRGSRNNGYVFDHVLVMERLIGRYLEDGETVHHLNGVRDDNRPENLELWTKPQPAGIRNSDAVKWAQEVLGRYAPELLNGRKSCSCKLDADPAAMSAGPPVTNEHKTNITGLTSFDVFDEQETASHSEQAM